jgi:hypothetical protein
MTTSFEPDGRLTAFGTQLIAVHDWLRDQLDDLRDGFDNPQGVRVPAHELRAHCLTFCSAVTRHHTGEDAGAFAVLSERFPQLRPVIAELERDHVIISGLLYRLSDLVASTPADPTPEQLSAARVELEGLAALLESHFTYEERKLVAALDTLGADTATTEQLLGVPMPGDPATES